MASDPIPDPKLSHAFSQWWRNESARSGRLTASRRFLALLWEFTRDSSPARRRQRYGDVDYDWDYRVDTTSATVGGRDRLLGLLHSPYQPTEPALFREMLENLTLASSQVSSASLDFRDFVFIDIGSGKGRVLLMAADYPFRRVIGVELLSELDRIAKENIRKYKSDLQKCFAVESVCGDAGAFIFPADPLVLYLFNPLPESGLVKMLGNLERSLREHPRNAYVIYHNPQLEHVLAGSTVFKRVGGTEQYAIFRT